MTNNCLNVRLKFNTFPLRRHAHKHYSEAGQSRKRKLESLPAPPELKIYDFINSSRLAGTASTTSGSKRRATPVESLRAHQVVLYFLIVPCLAFGVTLVTVYYVHS